MGGRSLQNLRRGDYSQTAVTAHAVAHLYMHSTDHDRMTSLQLQYEIISAFNKALALPICQACIIRVYIHSHIQHKDITYPVGDSFTLGFQAQIRWKSDLEIFR